jgi:hypothetical protein
MRVAGIRALGESVELFEVDEPAAPAAGEVLIDVVAAGIGNWDELVRIGSVGIGSGCKRSASIALPRRCHRIPPKCAAAAENWLRSCISAERGGTRVHNRGGS